MTESTGDSYFSEETSEAIVIAQMANAPDRRLATVMAAIVRHLHAAVKEVEPSPEEWMAAIQFLTDVGQKCTDWRQEFILLSDTLGVSMLVDAINHRKPSTATESTVLGPFHVANAPERANGDNICLDHKGTPLVMSGKVTDTEGRPIEGAKLDVWMTNEDGFYDVQQPGLQPPMNLRGIFRSGGDGSYWFRSVKPRYYPIPDDGPVGQLLRQLGRHPYRPAHIHFIVSADGFEPVTTHIFVRGDQYLQSDAVFGVKEGLIVDFVHHDDPDEAKTLGVTNPFYTAEQDFVLVNA